MKRILLACVLLLGASASAFSQSADDLRGTWAVQVDGRNLIVLTLQGEGSALSGTFQRPMSLSFGQATGAGTSITQVKMPVSSVTATEARSTPAGRVFSLRHEGNDAGEILVRPDGPDRARFGLAANITEEFLLPMVRVSDNAAIAADWVVNQSYLVRAPAAAPNTELAAIFVADQADRQGNIDWTVVKPRDDARKKRVREMLDTGLLRAADDYYNAAFVFQHSEKADDHLLAHVLAMCAMTLGRNDAAWIASATLDRYLQNTDKAQVLGTQYVGLNANALTQGKYDAALLPDSVRRVLGVPTREQQQERLKQMNARPQGSLQP